MKSNHVGSCSVECRSETLERTPSFFEILASVVGISVLAWMLLYALMGWAGAL